MTASVHRLSPRAPVVALPEFLPDAAEVEARPPPRLAWLTLYAVLALLTSAVAWASLASVDKIVTAPGKLVTVSPQLVVQPLDTAIIRDIHVAVGDVVRAGQALVTLDPTFPQSDLAQLQGRVAALDAEIGRLEAELGDRPFEAGPGPAPALEARLFAQRRAFAASTLQGLDAKIAHVQAELDANKDAERQAVKRLGTLQEIEAMRATLLGQQVGSRLNFLEAQEARIAGEAALIQLRGLQVQVGHALAQARSDRQTFIEEFRRNALEKLVEARSKRDAAAEDAHKAELRRQMVTLTAPSPGVVLTLAHRSVGSVVREAEPLVVLVPLDAKLEAEVNVEGRDVGELAVGQPVRLKLDAFPFQDHGTVAGRLRLISQDSAPRDEAPERDRQPPRLAYRVLVEMTDQGLRNLPPSARLMGGMSVQAETKVGRRSVISYFLYPLLRGLDESLREP